MGVRFDRILNMGFVLRDNFSTRLLLPAFKCQFPDKRICSILQFNYSTSGGSNTSIGNSKVKVRNSGNKNVKTLSRTKPIVNYLSHRLQDASVLRKGEQKPILDKKIPGKRNSAVASSKTVIAADLGVPSLSEMKIESMASEGNDITDESIEVVSTRSSKSTKGTKKPRGKETKLSLGIEEDKLLKKEKESEKHHSEKKIRTPKVSSDAAEQALEVAKKSNIKGSRKKKQLPSPTKSMNDSASKSVIESTVNGSVVSSSQSQESMSSVNCSSKPRDSGVGKKRPEKFAPLYPPCGKSVVIVESYTKAKVIQRYLGDMYEVLPSYGHVRGLACRSGSVRPDDDFSMVWEVPSAAWAHLASMKLALNGATNLILASDPDREGEAIAWHILEMMQQQDALHTNLRVARVVFHEITRQAIINALQDPREVSINLVNAYLARLALDYLIGFSVSPLLWRKLPGCQSAGRVQSAALALVCDRESLIEAFKPEEYWTVHAELDLSDIHSLNSRILANVTHFASQKLAKKSLASQSKAENVAENVCSSQFSVVEIKESKMNRNSPAPYITSTLQQDAANKFSFSAAYTMKLAQKLYEGVSLPDAEATGLITYTRTDGTHVSEGAIQSIRSLVTERYGQASVSKSIRKFVKKVKNAQEAHEAIRPTDVYRLPSSLKRVLDDDSLKLYTLIWCRAMGSQMEPVIIDKVQVNIGNSDGSTMLRTNGSKIGFLGYLAAHKDKECAAIGQDEDEDTLQEETYSLLCKLKPGHPIRFNTVKPEQHFTEPPPRYSEGTLVKELEELGIGRPSTYATIMKVLQERKYVTAKARRLFPEFRGRMVSAFLVHFFTEVMDYRFTSYLESELDNVSAGSTEWKALLSNYWARFSKYCNEASKVDIRQVEKMLEGIFGGMLFSSLPSENRTCPSCNTGTLIFKVGRHGSGYFIGCDRYPKCSYIAKSIVNDEDDDDQNDNTSTKPERFAEPKLIGLHPTSNEKILLKNGPYGHYVQLGEDRKGYVPKRTSISQLKKDPELIGIEDALELLRYPIEIGKHPETKKPLVLRISRHGFSIRHGQTTVPIPKGVDPKDVTMEMSLKYLKSGNARKIGRSKENNKVKVKAS